jgi:antitoxin (DNA-binding transcriptional repressor) of toxin-antitoxin stability system
VITKHGKPSARLVSGMLDDSSETGNVRVLEPT